MHVTAKNKIWHAIIFSQGGYIHTHLGSSSHSECFCITRYPSLLSWPRHCKDRLRNEFRVILQKDYYMIPVCIWKWIGTSRHKLHRIEHIYQERFTARSFANECLDDISILISTLECFSHTFTHKVCVKRDKTAARTDKLICTCMSQPSMLGECTHSCNVNVHTRVGRNFFKAHQAQSTLHWQIRRGMLLCSSHP